jgi:hypothetical protein
MSLRLLVRGKSLTQLQMAFGKSETCRAPKVQDRAKSDKAAKEICHRNFHARRG